MIDSYIALGSNLQHPLEQVNKALRQIAALPHSKLICHSSWYRSKAVGPGDQPDYINGVCKLSTTLDAIDLLHALQAIEQQQGRERLQRWAARTLDLDILLYENQLISLPELEIPHPRMKQRNFVLYPLYEISPELNLPDQTSMHELLGHCDQRGLEKLP